MFDVNAGEWSSFAAFTPCINLEGIGVCFLAPTEWEIAANPIAYALATELNDLLDGMGGFGPNIGIKIVTDDDPDFGHMAIDPIPDLPGDILGVVWFVKKDVNEADVVAIDMKLSSEFEVSYCDKLTRTVTADGTNKAYASRVSRGSGFINTDGFKTYLYYKPFDFVDFFNAIIGNAPSLNDTTCIYQQNIDQVAGQCIDNHQPSVAVINSRCDYVRENYSECIHSCDDFEGSGFDTCTCDADDPNLTDPYDDSDVGPNEPQCNPRAAFDGDSCWDAYAEMISCEYLVNRAIRDVDRYFSGASPENECFKTAGCYDWDENFNTGHCEIDYADGQHNDLSPLADPVAVVNGTHAVFQLAITYLNGTPPPANILISPGEEKGCYEGAYYEYIKEADMCTRGTLEGICQAQSINTTNNLNPDCTADEKDTDIWGNPTGGYNHSDVKHHNMWEIAGPPAMTICENEPFVDFGYYSSDYQPFGAIVPPPGGQGPVDWTSREGLYKFPLFYEPPRMGGFDPPYQARMGEIHTEEGLEELFVRSYGIWEWNWNDVDNPTQGGDYVKDEGAIGLSIPGVVCNEDTRAESTNEPCFIHPDIDISTPNNITDGIGLVGLEFNTMVDPDQLPITAFEIHWGDGDTTKVSGVSLRNRSNDENPFLIYHLYDYWKTTRADADLLNTSCTVGYCDVGITVKIWDNWGKDGSDSTSFNLYK
jgi:hypothetical protein